MKKFLLLISLSINFTLYANCESRPLTLDLNEAYKLALNQMETLKINEQGIKLAEAQYKEAISAIYPQLSIVVRETLQDNSNRTFSSSIRYSNSSSRFTGGFTVTQPIFSGFSDFLIAAAAKEEIKALKLDNFRAKELLYQDIAKLYLQIKYYKEDLAEINKSLKILDDRINELTNFVSLGKSKPSDQLAVEADKNNIQALKVQTLGLLTTSKEMFAYLIGLSIKSFEISNQPLKFTKAPIESYIVNTSERADISASKARIISLEKQLTASKRERLPTIGLEGNYNPIIAPEGTHDASISLNISVPIFDGGRIDSHIEQQNALLSISKLKTDQLQRESVRDVRIYFAKIELAEEEIKERINAVSAAEKSLVQERKDFATGIVNNLDVLQSIQRVLDARRNLLKSKSDLELHKIGLLVTTGGISQ